MQMSPAVTWFIVGTILIVAEFVVPGVVLVFFGVGAWLVAVTTYLGITGSLELQLLCWVISSLILLFALRKWVKNQFSGHTADEQDLTRNLDEFRGQKVKVVQAIDPTSGEGRVEYKGAEWSAMASEPIAAGEMVEVVALDGIKMQVKKLA